jgi:hypothetical protein
MGLPVEESILQVAPAVAGMATVVAIATQSALNLLLRVLRRR